MNRNEFLEMKMNQLLKDMEQFVEETGAEIILLATAKIEGDLYKNITLVSQNHHIIYGNLVHCMENAPGVFQFFSTAVKRATLNLSKLN